jgi:hypothetical protein
VYPDQPGNRYLDRAECNIPWGRVGRVPLITSLESTYYETLDNNPRANALRLGREKNQSDHNPGIE